jgi:hypothetical protein
MNLDKLMTVGLALWAIFMVAWAAVIVGVFWLICHFAAKYW